jgi:uncharacterized protein (UPF0548 family)
MRHRRGAQRKHEIVHLNESRLARHYGFWSLNACRVVYVVDDRGAQPRYGFAYGTLMEHAETGEERFTVELRPKDETVWYDNICLLAS